MDCDVIGATVADAARLGRFAGSTGPIPDPLRPMVLSVEVDLDTDVCDVTIARVLPREFCRISTVAAVTMPRISTRVPSRIRADHGATARRRPEAVVSVWLPSDITTQLSQTDPAEPKPHDARASPRTPMVRYAVTAKPNSKKGPLVEVDDDGNLTVFVRERAVEGAANDGLVLALAKHFGVPKSRVSVVRGQNSRHKIIEVDD